MKLDLQNFQAHAQTELELDGITVITGESNAGKSSIIRGLLWLITNKPTGTAFIKHGKKACEVRLDDIVRERSQKHNRYSIYSESDEQHYDAIKTDVPEVIVKDLNLVPANIQRQRDVDFLIGLTPTAAGALLDGTLHLTDISQIEAEAANKVRECTKECNAAIRDLQAVLASIDEFAWLEQANALNAKITGLKMNLDGWNKSLEKVNVLQGEIDYYNKHLEDLSWVEKLNAELAAYNKFHDGYDELKSHMVSCGAKWIIYQDSDRHTHDLSWSGKVSLMIEKWKELALEYNGICESEVKTLNLQSSLDVKGSLIKRGKEQLVELKKQLPKTCPTCGQAWSRK